MGHNVGTAAANAVKKSERVKPADRTSEQVLSDIRKNLAARLFVTPDDQRYLLVLYDTLMLKLEQNQTLLNQSPDIIKMATEAAEIANTEIVNLRSQVEQFRAVYEQENSSTEIKVERVMPTATGEEHQTFVAHCDELDERGGEA